MKKSLFLIVAALVFSWLPMNAQRTIGIESPIMEKNIFVGFKAGVTAMDMAYSVHTTADENFVNHSVLYSNPGKILNCLAGGITVERTLPLFSYGLELMATGVHAIADTAHFAELDSAYFLNARVPLRWYILGGKQVSPYLMIAPELGTYFYYEVDSVNAINGYSVWNGHGVDWGTRYTKSLNFNVLAGAGVNVRIDVNDYQFWARFEAAYRMGLMNTVPDKVFPDKPDMKVVRKMRGWEATISLSFPLFKNPHYQWLM